MRSRELYAIIASLTVAERKYVQAQIRIAENSADLQAIYKYASSHPAPSRKEMSTGTGLSARRISDLQTRLESIVVESLGHFEPDERTFLNLSLKTAQKMMLRLENSAAAVILQQVYDQAAAHELFDQMLKAIEIAEMLSEPFSIEGAERASVVARLRTLAGFRQLKLQVEKAKNAGPEERERLVREVNRSPLMQNGRPTDSFSAAAFYLSIRTRLLVYASRYREAAHNQGQLVELISDRPWLRDLPDYHLLKEINPYVGLLIATGDQPVAEQLIFRVGNLETPHSRVELLKWNQLYPMRLINAIAEGNEVAGDHAMDEMQSLFEEKEEIFSPQIIHRGLYFIAYYLIAKGDLTGARRTVLRMLRASRSGAFLPHYLPMTKVLSAIIDYESGEWDDLGLKIKNFRQTKAYNESPYYRMALNLLSRLTYQKSDLKRHTALQEGYEEAWGMQQDANMQAYFALFDLAKWIEGQQKGTSMIEVFRSGMESLQEHGRSAANGD